MSRAPYSFRSDATVPAFPDDRPIVIFDGKCVLCAAFARFLFWVDRKRQIGTPDYIRQALAVQNDRLTLVPRRWSLLGVAMPMWLRPRSIAYEAVAAGRFRFHIAVSFPLIGQIVRCRGRLKPDSAGGRHG